MNSLDMYIGAAMLVLFAYGIQSGIIRSLISVFGVYLAVYLSQNLTDGIIKMASILSAEESKIGHIVVLIVTFIVLCIIVEFFLYMLKNVINISILGSIDKILGGIIGASKALVIAGFIIEAVMLLPPSKDQLNTLNHSFLKDWADKAFKNTYPLTISAVPKIRDFFTERVEVRINSINFVSAEAEKIKKAILE
ncbi:MAG: hypothetical protein FD145_406 [Candidatus Saganbacteria bacterium]|uniref:CvpA family protein n=1 Tax=Candidatus Saganbacteria bacterium TaxID=2575572 RepID=A0A833L1V8_UNCSA|nr:MAG: hypothetical protein FD145_406 [Candidatus Saganbacteria bacterium]